MLTIRRRCSTPAMCSLLLATGCGSQSFLADDMSSAGDLLAVKVADYSGAGALAAQADAVTEESRIVLLPAELTQDTPDAVIIALTPADIVVAFDGGAAGRMNPTAKGRAAHATVGFRLAELLGDACLSELAVGPFELTIADGTVSVDPAEMPIPAEALAIFRNGRLALCSETWADFDGSISLGDVAFETGRLHAHENRVTLCHMPLGEEGEAHTVTVGSSAVDAHLTHGDRIGDCDGADDEDGHQGDDGAGGQPEGDDADGDADEDDGEDDGEDSGDSDEDGDDSDDEADEDGEDEGGDDTEGPQDLDNDGVPDDLDRCPNTPTGETVDATGCSCSQTDADADGVNDCNDACAGSATGLSVDADGCAADQLDDDGDAVMNDADICPNTSAGATVDANGCSCSQLDADSDGVDDCDDLCAQTPAGETPDSDGCSNSQLTVTVTVPGPTDIYLAGQPDGTTATWTLTGWTSVAPQHSPVMIDISTWAGKELRFTASGTVITGGNNAATPDGRDWVLRPNGLSQVFGLTAMTDYREGALVGVFLTAASPTSGLLPYMSSSGMTTTTPLIQHVFVIGSSSQVVVPTGATRLFFGVAEQQGLIIDNGGSFDVTVEAVPHTLLPSDPLFATRFYVGNPNDPKDGIGWFDAGQWAFDYNFDGVADFTTTFGQAGDTPLVGDWNGDGLDEIGVMTPSASGNVWTLDTNGNGVFDAGDATFTYGADAGAIAVAGDWDGDGVSEFGFTTPDNLWHLDLDGDRVDGAGEALDAQYNRSISVVGDWTGDGVSNLGNTPNGSVGWQFDLDNDRRWIWGTTYRDQNWSWGDPSIDTGVAGDWDGDGLDDPARYRASTGDWHFTTRVGKGVLVGASVVGFGANSTPVTGSWATIRAAD